MDKFPDGFLWGAATSAHQVEGDNILNDWWKFEVSGKLKYQSGQACRHYSMYEGDFDLAQKLNHNCHRFSIEWSRVEPEEGIFSDKEIEHYKAVVSALKRRGLEPIVTLHHFTNPLWFAQSGGWTLKSSTERFLNYVEKITNSLKDDVRFWVTINEPMVYVYHSFLLGLWPPQEASLLKTWIVQKNLLQAHIKAYHLINKIYEENRLGKPFVSIAQNMQDFVPCRATARNKFAAFLRSKVFNLDFISRSFCANALDFIGVNYYSRSLVELRGWGIKNFSTDVCQGGHDNLKKNSMGWDIYPQGLYHVLLSLKKYNMPVFILENGICTADDNLRWEFIREHLEALRKAIEAGVKTLGYVYWSLLDNYEWDKGFAPRFGLVEVDYSTYKRTIRESAVKFAQVCLSNSL